MAAIVRRKVQQQFRLVVLAGMVGTTSAPDAAAFIGWGPQGVGWQNVDIERPDATTFAATIYYPASSTGRHAPISGSEAPYPAVTYGHGFASPPIIYILNMAHLASHGYVVVAPWSGLELLPDWFDYADDFRSCLDFLERENAMADSPLFGAIDTEALGMTGHSMGGGSSILAAAADPRVRAVVPLAPAKFGPPSLDAIATITAPMCIVAATDDAITPMANHAVPLFREAPSPSLMAIVQGGSHCQFADLPVPDPFCDVARIDGARQRELVRSYVVGFLDLYLKGKTDAWGWIWGPSALFNPDVTVRARPGLQLQPQVAVRIAAPGAPVTADITLRHQGLAADRFSLAAWGTAEVLAIDPARTPEIAPGGQSTIRLTLASPPGAASFSFAFLHAYAESDGVTGTFAMVLLLSAP